MRWLPLSLRRAGIWRIGILGRAWCSDGARAVKPDGLAQDAVVMLPDSSTGLEDVVEMYAACPPPLPGKCRPAHFHHYIRLRVRTALRTLLKDRVPRPGNIRQHHEPREAKQDDGRNQVCAGA